MKIESGKQESRKRFPKFQLSAFRFQLLALLLLCSSAFAYVAKAPGDIDTLVAAGYAGLTSQRCLELGNTVKNCPPANYDVLYAIFQATAPTAEKNFIATLFNGSGPAPTPTPNPGPASAIVTLTQHGVANAADPTDGQTLIFDANSGLWRPGSDARTLAQLGSVYQVYISNREISNNGDGIDGIGSQTNPRNVGTSAKLESVLASIPPYSTINLIQGPFLIKRHDLVTTNVKSGWTIQGNGMYETIVRLDPTEVVPTYGGSIFSSQYNLSTDGVTIRDLTVDSNWPAVAASATVGAGSNTFTASITSGSPILVGGSDSVGNLVNSGNGFTAVDLTRALTGTGIPGATTVLRNSATTVSMTSDGATLPQSTINVASTADFASAGTFFIVTSSGPLQYVTYTGKTSTTFTGCTGGTLMINASNPVSTLSQLVMSANATATNASASITIGGEREGALGAIAIAGSNNLVERVRSINTYGSNANGQELFAICLGTPSGTDGQPSNGSTNNIIRNCLVEQPCGNYGAPFAMSGADNARPITQSKVTGNTVKGVNNGLNGGFTTGGVNMAWIKGVEISGNTFNDCSGLSYIDTGSMDGLIVSNNKLIRGSFGVGLAQSGVASKKNVWVFHNRFLIQNRGNGGGSSAIGNIGSTATTNLNVHDNSVGFDYGGLGLNTQTRFIYSTVGFVNGEIRNNDLDTDGNGTYIAALTNVRIKGNFTLSTGTIPSNPDGGVSLADNDTTAGGATSCIGATIGTGSKDRAGSVTATTTGTSTVVITFSTAAPTGWSITASNNTTANSLRQTAKSTTTATFAGTTVTGDVITYAATPY